MIRSTQTVILIVDDEPRNIQIASNVLKEVEGCHILYATSGKQALERLKSHSIDLILLDIMMPDMDGIEVCQRLKANPESTDIPVIFLTARTDEDSLIKAFDAGAVDYVSKPFSSRELLLRVQTQLKLRLTQRCLNNELADNKELLKQYKQIVDSSLIVTKTDLKGKITYVNDQFCEISGYTREELIGRSHSIVRHPDVPSSVYKDLWEKITNKQKWSGIVKNLKKNGEYYIVDSTVAPIVDSLGEVIEYISIRTDVTDIFKLTEEIEATQMELLRTLGDVGESRSEETAYHVVRVAEYTKILAIAYGLSDQEIDTLWNVAPMHDIGKVGVPDYILNKPDKLTEEEFATMKTHAETGYTFFKNSPRPLLQAAAIVAYEHHERWDGFGYPRGIRGEEIHIYGRITAIADVFDALGTKRVYKEAWNLDQILEYFREQRGKQFDPKLVDILFTRIDDFVAIKEKYQDT